MTRLPSRLSPSTRILRSVAKRKMGAVVNEGDGEQEISFEIDDDSTVQEGLDRSYERERKDGNASTCHSDDSIELVHESDEDNDDDGQYEESPKEVHEKEETSSQVPVDSSVWTTADQIRLRSAVADVDPQATDFWNRVGRDIGRDSGECRQRWFSLVKTPQKQPTSNLQNDRLYTGQSKDTNTNRKGNINRAAFTARIGSSGTRPSSSVSTLFPFADDDIFQATPMKTIVFPHVSDPNAEGPVDIGMSRQHETKDEPDRTCVHDDFLADLGELPFVRKRKGYKTYLQGMGRNVRKAQREHLKGNTPMTVQMKGMKMTNRRKTVVASAGNVEMVGQLTPRGTLRVKRVDYSSDSSSSTDDFNIDHA